MSNHSPKDVVCELKGSVAHRETSLISYLPEVKFMQMRFKDHIKTQISKYFHPRRLFLIEALKRFENTESFQYSSSYKFYSN